MKSRDIRGVVNPADAREILPKPDPPFKGHVGRTVKDSSPDFPKGIEAPEGAPNVLSEKDAAKIGVEAYIYGYPLVTMEMTRRRMTNVATVEAERAPMGQFVHKREFPTAAYRDVPGANVDTLYSSAWIDLAKEPYVLSLPEQNDRSKC